MFFITYIANLKDNTKVKIKHFNDRKKAWKHIKRKIHRLGLYGLLIPKIEQKNPDLINIFLEKLKGFPQYYRDHPDLEIDNFLITFGAKIIKSNSIAYYISNLESDYKFGVVIIPFDIQK